MKIRVVSNQCIVKIEIKKNWFSNKIGANFFVAVYFNVSRDKFGLTFYKCMIFFSNANRSLLKPELIGI